MTPTTLCDAGLVPSARPKPSRRQWLREWLARHGDLTVDEPGLRRLRGEMEAALPASVPAPALERLAEEVHDLGGRVHFGDLTGGVEDRLLSLESLTRLAAGLRDLQACLARAQQAGDGAGVERARMAARRARRRALLVARNRRAHEGKRAVKQEMADWLLLWLELPEAFFEWLPLRQRSAEYLSIAMREPPAVEN